jgi:hypothetical protein
MRGRLIVPAVLGAFVLSTAAFAAGSTSTPVTPKDQNKVQTAEMKGAARCTALEKQFDGAINSHSGAKADSARLLRTEGQALCGKGDHTAGVIKLEQALKDIDQKPAM